jgi:hypothetical protein
VFDGHPDEARKHGFLFGGEGKPGYIADGTIITHTAYPDRLYGYEALEVVGINAEPTYRILREGASISTGTVAELTAAGFRFNAPEVTVEEIEALLTPEEPTPSAMRQAWLACEEANRTLSTELEARSATISDLRGEVTALGADVATLRSRLNGSEAALRDFKERVRSEVESAKVTHDLCIDGCNSFLEELGLPLLSKKWKVTVTRDSDYEVLLTVTGVEADTESAAIEAVEENFTVKATVTAVTFDYEYDGEGDADWDHEDYSADDWDETDDGMADDHKDGLSFSAEEE